MFDDDDHFGIEDALAFGTGYAFLRHGQDQQTQAIVDAIDHLNTRPDPEPDYEPEPDPEPEAEPINAIYYALDVPEDWEEYIGQAPLKRQMLVHASSALSRGRRLPHTLLASGYPGVGKTTLARLMAVIMGTKIMELQPPFKLETLVRACLDLRDGDILFIDEIHKLTDGVGARGAEVLLKLLEDGVIFEPDGTVHVLHDFTVIGATTEKDKLPEPVVDRFKIKPYFQAYSLPELARIAVKFMFWHEAENDIDDQIIHAIAYACRGVPRISEEMVLAAQALHDSEGRIITPAELLAFLEVEPDGLTRQHIHYLTALRQYFARETKEGDTEYIIGEAAIMQILRETKPGIGRVERFLVERGLIDRTPRGRRLTPLGIARAEAFIREGKAASDVA